MILTSSDEIKNTKDYLAIVEVIERMDRTNVLWLGRGQCISMSDILCAALFQVGIKAKMVECQAVITNHNVVPSESVTIGYDGSNQPGQIDTHVVCVTQTEIPMIIDASISFLLPSDKKILVDKIIDADNRVFYNTKCDGFDLTYQQKTTNKIGFEHQRSIIDRIETDNRIFKNMNWLKTLIIISLSISTVNALRGAYDFYNVYFTKNSWGPQALEKLDSRLDTIEGILHEPEKKDLKKTD
jgi:hypothetical protein